MIFFAGFISMFLISAILDFFGVSLDDPPSLREAFLHTHHYRRSDQDEPNIVFGVFTELQAGIEYPEFYRQEGHVATIPETLEIPIPERLRSLTIEQFTQLAIRPMTIQDLVDPEIAPSAPSFIKDENN
jgi:hypothetical protein